MRKGQSIRTTINIGLTFGRQILAGLLQLGLTLLIARALGPDGTGMYAISLLLPTLMAQILGLGLISANVYYVASKQFALQDVWESSRDLMLLLSVIGVIIGSVLVFAWGKWLFPSVTTSTLLIAVSMLPALLFLNIAIGIFQATQDFGMFNRAILAQPLIALVMVFLLWSIDHISLQMLMLAILLSQYIALCFVVYMLSHRVVITSRTNGTHKYLPNAISYGWKAHTANLAGLLSYRIDLMLVNYIAGPAAAGLYLIAVRLAEQLWMISHAVATVLFPKLSEISEEEHRSVLTPLMARTVLWLTSLAASLLAVVSEYLISTLFGGEFDGASGLIHILLPGIVLFSWGRIFANDLAARGRVGINLVVACCLLISNFVGNLTLIPILGESGAAVSTSLSYTCAALAYFAILTKVMRLSPKDCVLPNSEDLLRLQAAYSACRRFFK